MKKLLIIGIVSLLSATMAMAEQVVVQTKNITLVLDVNNGKQPTYVYFGSKLNANELGHLQYPTNGRMEVYPAHGLNTPAEDALAMRHSQRFKLSLQQLQLVANRHQGFQYVVASV